MDYQAGGWSCLPYDKVCVKEGLLSSVNKSCITLKVAAEVTERRLTKTKTWVQSGPVLLLVSGLGFGLGQSCFA